MTDGYRRSLDSEKNQSGALCTHGIDEKRFQRRVEQEVRKTQDTSVDFVQSSVE